MSMDISGNSYSPIRNSALNLEADGKNKKCLLVGKAESRISRVAIVSGGFMGAVRYALGLTRPLKVRDTDGEETTVHVKINDIAKLLGVSHSKARKLLDTPDGLARLAECSPLQAAQILRSKNGLDNLGRL